MKFLFVFLFLILSLYRVNCDYIQMIPYINSECTEEGGVGYIFNQDSNCNLITNVTTTHSVNVNILGLIASFQFFNNLNCSKTSNDNDNNEVIYEAYKHNKCYQLPNLLNYYYESEIFGNITIGGLNNTNSNQYFLINFIDSIQQLNQFLDNNQPFALKKIQYNNENDCINGDIKNGNFQMIQYITNNFKTIVSPTPTTSSFTCNNNNNEPTIQVCLENNNNKCINESLSLPCSNFDNSYSIIQSC